MNSNDNIRRFKLIKQSVALRNITFADIARKLDVSRSTITFVAQGRRVSKRVRRALARACNLAYEELWK